MQTDKLMSVFNDIVNITDNDIKKSNANINGNTAAGIMYLMGSESSKEYALTHLISPKFVEAYKDNYIHIHDLDYYAMRNWNCNHIDLVELFKKPYIYTSDSVIRQPKRLATYGALAAIALQSEQAEQYGGQSIHSLDFALADGVRKSFMEDFKKFLAVYNDLNSENALKEPDDSDICIGNEEIKENYNWVYNKALASVTHEAHEVCAALIYNLCTMHSRAGNQVVFSSVNYGTDFSPEGRIIINAMLDAVDEGLGNGGTAIFPISVFRVKDGVSFDQKDWLTAKANWEEAVNGKIKFNTPNFDLFLKACKVSAHRLFPNFVFEDTPFNKNDKWRIDDPDRYKYEISTMGCRTRVYSDINGEKTCARRGNLAFTTLNLPKLAIESSLACEDKDERLKLFFDKLDYYVHLIHDQLKERYEWQCSSYAKQYPFIVMNGLVMGTEDLDIDKDKIGEDVLKHGTLGIGYIGLAECLKKLIGVHHGESDEAQELGLKIIERMRYWADKFTTEEFLNFGVFATPAEGLSGKLTKKDREKYGSIPGVTDRNYYTNSNHVPVYYNLPALKKIKLEAPYHDLANAGNITYIEMDGDARNNVKAFAELVVAMHDNNIGYGSVNHSAADHCDICDYQGPISDEGCPKCGNKDEKFITRIRRITGYLTGDLKERWNSYKRSEERDRVKHL